LFSETISTKNWSVTLCLNEVSGLPILRTFIQTIAWCHASPLPSFNSSFF